MCRVIVLSILKGFPPATWKPGVERLAVAKGLKQSPNPQGVVSNGYVLYFVLVVYPYRVLRTE